MANQAEGAKLARIGHGLAGHAGEPGPVALKHAKRPHAIHGKGLSPTVAIHLREGLLGTRAANNTGVVNKDIYGARHLTHKGIDAGTIAHIQSVPSHPGQRAESIAEPDRWRITPSPWPGRGQSETNASIRARNHHLRWWLASQESIVSVRKGMSPLPAPDGVTNVG